MMFCFTLCSLLHNPSLGHSYNNNITLSSGALITTEPPFKPDLFTHYCPTYETCDFVDYNALRHSVTTYSNYRYYTVAMECY